MQRTRFTLSVVLCSITLAACPPAPTNRPDGSSSLPDASAQQDAGGSAFCSKLAALGCPVAPRCEELLDPVRVGVPAECRPQWSAFVRCLEQSAPTLQCAQVPESGQPLICTDELRASDQCYQNLRDASAPSDASEPSDAGPAAAIGTINVTMMVSSALQLVGTSAERGAPSDSCTVVASEGACSYRTCGDQPLPMLVAMGDVVFTNGSNTTTMQPDAMGIYGTTRVAWPAGSTTMVMGAGDNGVPAFSASMQLPPTFVGTTMSAPARDATIDRSADLVVQWTAEDFGTANITVGTGTQQVRCTAAPTAGTLTIPAALLGRLSMGVASITVETQDESVQRVAGWDVRVLVGNGSESRMITLR